jgi:hypothetical protein
MTPGALATNADSASGLNTCANRPTLRARIVFPSAFYFAMSLKCGIKLQAAFADGPPIPRSLRVAQTGGGGKVRLLRQSL